MRFRTKRQYREQNRVWRCVVVLLDKNENGQIITSDSSLYTKPGMSGSADTKALKAERYKP